MDKPLVNILVPCRDQAGTIRAAIDSALMQDYPRLEVVVSDSGSRDGSVGIIKSYNDERLRTYFHENRSRIDNYRGLHHEYARGTLSLNLDGDDYLTDPSYISKAVAAYEAHPGTVLVFAKMGVLLEHTGELISETVNDNLPPAMDGKWLFTEFPKGHTFPFLTCLFDTVKAREVEVFRKDITSMDWEAMLKLILHGRVCFLKETVGVYRRHGSNNSRTLDIDWILEGAEYVENPYAYALREHLLPVAVLKKWRSKLLKRYFLKHLIRVLLLRQRETEVLFQKKIRERYPELSDEISRDVRYRLFRLVHRYEPLTELIFKYYVKQESFHKELLNTTAGGQQSR
jgi:glycosyltransferase involved in cell wall biosynthesis